MLQWTLPLLLISLVGWPFGQKKKADRTAFEQALEAAVAPGVSHAVVLQHGIPASAATDVGVVKHEKAYTVDVANGNWATPFEGTAFWDDHLSWAEVVAVDSVRVKDERVELRVVSLANRMVPGGWLGSDRPGAVATRFRVSLQKDQLEAADVDEVLKHFEPLLRLFGSETEAREYAEALRAGKSALVPPPAERTTLIVVGMLQPQVRELMGPPQSERKKGKRTTWLYSGEEVIFEADRVVEVHIR